jgi:hypothetical protein
MLSSFPVREQACTLELRNRELKQDMCVYVHTDFTLMANCSYSPTKKALPKWVIAAKRKVAKWRQNLVDARSLVRAYYFSKMAEERGIINAEQLREQNITAMDNLPKIALQAVEKKLGDWEERLVCVEELVYSS